MKKPRSRKKLEFIHGELEIALAIFALLAFIVGSAYAYKITHEPQGNNSEVITISQTPISGANQIRYQGNSYTGIAFGQKIAGYLYINHLEGGSQYFTDQSVELINPNDRYQLNLTLDSALNSTPWYLDFSGDGRDAQILVNNELVTSRSQPLDLSGSTSLQIITDGSVSLRSLSKTAPGSTPLIPSTTIKSIYIAPTSTELNIGAIRKFLVLALDDKNNNVNISGAVSWRTSNSNIATVSSDGTVTGIATGDVQITAAYGSVSANARVVVTNPNLTTGTGTGTITTPTTTTEPEPTTQQPTSPTLSQQLQTVINNAVSGIVNFFNSLF